MTSKLTREQLHERARENVKALKMASRQTAFESAREEILADLQLAELALAAMDSKPVAWTDEQELRDVDRGGCGYLFTVNPVTPHADERRIILLYRHAQPAPVVPDGYVMVPVEPNGDMLAAAQDAYGETDGDIASTLRAAMLAADPQLPGSEPATVPGKWIPVSERMPEAGGDMIVFTDGIVMSGVSYAKKKGFYIQALEYDDDEPVDSVTHWMPLPAAPQEVKDAHH
ncbi:TPA: DUF551 domain-containing protein [Escherichia coli]|nr:DUF551 domain-containing protein [Escherichia coli]